MISQLWIQRHISHTIHSHIRYKFRTAGPLKLKNTVCAQAKNDHTLSTVTIHLPFFFRLQSLQCSHPLVHNLLRTPQLLLHRFRMQQSQKRTLLRADMYRQQYTKPLAIIIQQPIVRLTPPNAFRCTPVSTQSSTHTLAEQNPYLPCESRYS